MATLSSLEWHICLIFNSFLHMFNIFQFCLWHPKTEEIYLHYFTFGETKIPEFRLIKSTLLRLKEGKKCCFTSSKDLFYIEHLEEAHGPAIGMILMYQDRFQIHTPLQITKKHIKLFFMLLFVEISCRAIEICIGHTMIICTFHRWSV